MMPDRTKPEISKNLPQGELVGKQVTNKVVLVGAGDVGLAYAYALVNQGTVDHLAMIDIDEKRLKGNVMDLNHGAVWAGGSTTVTVGSYEDCADADLLVICAGAAQKPGETRLQLVDKNLKILKSIIEPAMANDFDGIILVASNPVDILSYGAWKFSGLPAKRVFGSGTILDTARYRWMLGEMHHVSPSSIHAYIAGEHGDSELPVVSTANIAGVPLRAYADREDGYAERIEKVFHETRDAAYDIIDAKGSTSYGIGMGLARLTKAIFKNQYVALPVSALLKGEYGQSDIYLGTPAIINRGGVNRVIELDLDEHEKELFDKSATQLREIMDEEFK